MTAIETALLKTKESMRYHGYWYNLPSITKLMEEGVWAELHIQKAYEKINQLSGIFLIKLKH